MQNSELYRRGFVVPLTKEAEDALNNNNINNNTLVQSFEIPTEEVFITLWEKGLFKMLNSKLGIMIDDFEEEKVDYTEVESIKDIITEFMTQNDLNIEEMETIDTLRKLCDTALDKKTSIFIIL